MTTSLNRKRGLALTVIGFIGSAFGIGAPTGLAVAPIDYTQAACNIDCSARLNWTAPTEGTPTLYKVYRRLAAHEHPTLAGSVGADTTSFTDSTATVGALYSYTVTAVDGDGESAESSAVSYRQLENVALASKGNVTLNNPTLGNGNVANANDGAINNVVLSGNSAAHLLVLSFKEERRPRLAYVRLNFGSWGGNANTDQYFNGMVMRDGVEIKTEFDGATTFPTHRFTKDAWNLFPVAASLQEDVWTKFTFGGGNWYGNCRELEAYGYLPTALLGTPVVVAPILGDGEVLLRWLAAANAATYTVYRKMGEGAWETVATSLTTCLFKDSGLVAGAAYTYCVAAVAANGDESSAAEGMTVTAKGAVAEIPPAYGLVALPIDFTQAACNVDCSAHLSWSLISAACYDKVRVYRFLKGHEDETPAPIATLDKATATFTDTAATVGQEYVYRVACFNSSTGLEGPLSDAADYRKVKNLAKHNVNGTWAKTAGEPLTSWGDWQNWNNLCDGVAGTGSGIRIEGNGTLTFTFTATARPKLVAMRAMSANMNGATAFICKGTVVRNGASSEVAFDGGNTTVNFPKGEWTVRVIAPAHADDVWGTITLANSSGSWQYPCFSEVEAYGYVPGDTTGFLSAPELSNPVAGKKAVSLVWTAAANAASYKIYRRAADGAWGVAYENVTVTTLEDADVTFDGTTYAYRVAGVAANGDELSSAEKTVLCPMGAPFWWNFLNVKSVAFPGAAAYANPTKVKPHYMSRDKAGTLLVVPMSTDDGAHPAVTFDLAALASADNLGELTTAQTGMKQYGIFSDFGGAFGCWKGAAVSADLVVIGNGGADDEIAVVERATGACVSYRLMNESGTRASFTLDGGLDFDAAGAYLYTNDGMTQNKIVKWQVDASAKTVRKVAEYTAAGFTRIRNLAIYTVGGEEYAFFGEGSAKTGKIGALKLSDGSVATVVTDAANLADDIMNVKVAAADGETYVIAQLDTAAAGVYALDAATMTATLEKTIDAETMKALYGTANGGQYRNFEMTADGRFAFVMNNAGATTRLSVIGATEPLLPGTAPELTGTSDYSNKFTPTLNWAEADDVCAESVRVFRAQVGKPGATALADVPLGTKTYVDETAVAGVPYAYSVAYVHTVNGEPLVGVRSAEVEAMALIDLKTKKTGTYRKGDGGGSDTLPNLFDDSLGTGHGNSGYNEQAAFSVSEPVQVMAARFAATAWAASDTYPRADKMHICGKRTSAGGNWYDGKVVIGVGPDSVRGADWVNFALNEDAASEVGYDYVTFYSGSSQPYLNLQEIDVYGALPGPRAASLAKTSEAGRDDAPADALAARHVLTWTESGALTGVIVLRARTKEGPFVEIARVDPGVGEFLDETAVDGVVYYYQLVYLNEFEGVMYEGLPSAAFADYGLRLDATTYRSAILQGWTANWSGGYALDDNANTVVNGPDGGSRYGVAFREPVVVNAIAVRGPDWSVNANGYRIDDLVISAAPQGISGINETTQPGFLQITGEAAKQFVQIGTTPSGCHTANRWYVTPTTSDSAFGYLYLFKSNWFASISGLRVYGYPQTTVEEAKTAVVWPVENVTARMDDATLTLSWTLANALATSITVKHRVAGGAWTEIATLAGDATTFTTDEVAIGRYNEYRFVMGDGNDVVWAEKDFAVCPLLSKGTRTVLGCTATQAWDYLTVDSASEFTATFKLAGSTQEALGLTPGKGSDRFCNLYLRKDADATPAVQVQRHWVSGNSLGWYAYDAETSQPGWNYAIVWSGENDPSATFKINRSGTSYRLRTAAADGALADTANYTFVGDDHLDNGPCLAGVLISDPNLKTLSQIAPISVKVSTPGLAIVVR